MANGSGQKFIARNRAPRVQIEYDVENYGSNKKVQLPFVVGVMTDLLGNPAEPAAKLEDRKFLEFDHDNFNNRMRAMKPCRAPMWMSSSIPGPKRSSVSSRLWTPTRPCRAH